MTNPDQTRSLVSIGVSSNDDSSDEDLVAWSKEARASSRNGVNDGTVIDLSSDVENSNICQTKETATLMTITKTKEKEAVGSEAALASKAILRKVNAVRQNTKPIQEVIGKKQPRAVTQARKLQAGIVLEEDVVLDAYDSGDDPHSIRSYTWEQQQRISRGERAILYHDASFEAVPSSIDGSYKQKKTLKCRCSPSQAAKLSYSQKDGLNKDRPYYHCAKRKCRYFKWAFQAERMHWYRFGSHNHHKLVNDEGFLPEDLLQGKVGDCWFLSALAVIAERPDLIMRLFQTENNDFGGLVVNDYGIVQVNLFLDGYWKKVIIDNFLPCIIDIKGEKDLQVAIRKSLNNDGAAASLSAADAAADRNRSTIGSRSAPAISSSKYDPHALSEKNLEVITNTNEFMQQDKEKKSGIWSASAYVSIAPPRKLGRLLTSDDLAYSKAKKNQLWVPFLEKAYSKSHGCYQAISGGHIAEAFLDLTGAPTLVYNFEKRDFHPRTFWHKLLSYRKQRLPMGCGTSSSAVGIVGMHAYSILDVQEIHNVKIDFFKDKLLSGVHGNVSGFTDFDGTVRLLRIRNPHGKGEWKGDFSDNSSVWTKLLRQQDGRLSHLERTMKNDGTFWIDYDNFLLAFSNVDVVLAFMGNHAKSFPSNFPPKKSNHRCVRAFEVSLLIEEQEQQEQQQQQQLFGTDCHVKANSKTSKKKDTVDLYIMGIQKTRRGAYHGRFDRKVSYKLSDFGILVGEKRCAPHDNNADDIEFDNVEGKMFGFTRNNHYHLILDRKEKKSLVVMPVSFGHPAATDKELSFVLRFVSDSPLFIRELPEIPRMHRVIQQFCFQKQQKQQRQAHFVDGIRRSQLHSDLHYRERMKRKHRILFGDPLFYLILVDCMDDGGGTVFIYLCVSNNDKSKSLKPSFKDNVAANRRSGSISFSIEANCRGMACRTENGLLQHETISKGKRFEAAWRRFTCDFRGETKSRLLMILVQSGQDTQMGQVHCKKLAEGFVLGKGDSKKVPSLATFFSTKETHNPSENTNSNKNLNKHHVGGHSYDDHYEKLGIFSGTHLNYSPDENLINLVGIQGGHGEEDDNDNMMMQVLALSRRDAGVSADMELQQALELSRAATVIDKRHLHDCDADADLQKALEMSRKETVGDADLEKALERSKKQAENASLETASMSTVVSRNIATATVTSIDMTNGSAGYIDVKDNHCDDKDLERALAESKKTNNSNWTTGTKGTTILTPSYEEEIEKVVRLSMKEEGKHIQLIWGEVKKHETQNNSNNPIVDLVSSDDDDEPGSNVASLPPNNIVSRKRKVGIGRSCSAATESSSYADKNVDVELHGKPEHNQHNVKENIDRVSEKRILAAEAAEKRQRKTRTSSNNGQ